MRTLKVLPVKAVDTYDTFEEAIAAASRGPRVRIARKDSARLKGHSVVRISTALDCTIFEFSSRLRLKIFLAPNGDAVWKLQPRARETGRPAEEPVTGIERIRLRSAVRGNPLNHVWQPREDAKSLIGREFSLLFPSSCWLFLHFRGQEIMFAGFRDVRTGERILHWGPC
jgi:hypothetical protein